MPSSYFVVMMRIKYVVAVAILIAAVGAGAYILSRGFSARDEPTAVEAFIARRLRLLAIPRHARELTNPVQVSDEVFSRAMMHFADRANSVPLGTQT